MHVSIDKTGVYNYCIRGIDNQSSKEGFFVAQQIEAMIADNGLVNGSVIATEAMLRSQLRTGHSVLRQAIRILESRYACRMRRGPGGGLFVSKPTRDEAVNAIAGYLRSNGTQQAELIEALTKLDGLATKPSTASKRDGLASNAKQSTRAVAGAIAMHSSNTVLSFFATAIDAALDSSLSTPIVQNDDVAKAVGSSAAKFADQLGAEIQRRCELSTTAIWLGTEVELCDRYAVSRAVFRQALCILEADGISTARRGRSGGIWASKPNPGRAIDIVVGYLSSDDGLHRGELEISLALYEITTELACARWSEVDELRLRSLIERGVSASRGNEIMICFDIEWKAMHNGALEFMMRALAAYSTRFLNAGFNTSESAMQRLQDSHLDRLHAISNRDAARAGEILAQRIASFESLNLMRV